MKRSTALRRGLVIAATLGCAFQAVLSHAVPVIGTEKQISVDAAVDVAGQISGAYIVYSTFRAGNSDVVLVRPDGDENLLAPLPAAQDAPDIDRGRVVWADQRFGNPDIWLYDISGDTTRPLTFDAEADLAPAISGDNVVYVSIRSGQRNVRWIDLNTGEDEIISPLGAGSVSAPAIDGNLAAWQVVRGSSVDIFATVLGGTPFPVAAGPANETSPSVSQNRIAYIRGGDVFLYDVASGLTTQITNDAAIQRNVILDGQQLFWSDDRNGNSDVFVHELLGDRTFQLTSSPANQLVSDASGGRAVFTDDRFGAADVWVVDFAIPPANAPEPNSALLFGRALAILLLAYTDTARPRGRQAVSCLVRLRRNKRGPSLNQTLLIQRPR